MLATIASVEVLVAVFVLYLAEHKKTHRVPILVYPCISWAHLSTRMSDCVMLMVAMLLLWKISTLCAPRAIQYLILAHNLLPLYWLQVGLTLAHTRGHVYRCGCF